MDEKGSHDSCTEREV